MDGADAQDPADIRRSQLLAIMARVAERDRLALRELYDRTAAKLLGICVRICVDQQGAKDLPQEVYVAVWNRAAGFDPDRSRPITWLTTIARNRAIDWRRSRRNADNMLPIDAAWAVAGDAKEALDMMPLPRNGLRHRCITSFAYDPTRPVGPFLAGRFRKPGTAIYADAFRNLSGPASRRC